jgi:hypothetical protein
MEVLRGVFVLRRVATANVAADHAQPEVDPAIVHLQALFAAMCMRFDVIDLVQV